TLISGIPSAVGDRFGVIAPSSIVGVGSTTDHVQIVHSYDFSEPEIEKWINYIGTHLLIHNEDFSVTGQTILAGVDEINGRFITVSPPLGFAPTSGMIVDFDYYNADVHEDIVAKTVHWFWAKDSEVVSGISTTQFEVGSGDLEAYGVGYPVIVHNDDFSVESDETTVAEVSGTIITVADDLGFTPTSGMTASLLGFPDGKVCYRLL